jgi:hypothetical protein
MNALRAFVILAALALTNCQVAQADSTAYGLDEPFSLGGGQEAAIRGEPLRLRFTEVLEDSRCPTQVACFWTGQARVAVAVQQSDGAPTTLEFNTNPAPGQNVQTARVGPYAVDLAALDPYPQRPGPMAFGDYRATMTVRRI